MTYLTNQELMNNMETIEKFKVGDNVVIRSKTAASESQPSNLIATVIGFRYNCFNEILLVVSVVSSDEESYERWFNIRNETFAITKIS